MNVPPQTIHDVQLIEQAEADYFRRFLAGAPARSRARLGIWTTRIGDGMGAAMRNDPSGYWTKAMGFGFDVPVNQELVAETIRFFRAAGRRSGLIAIAPAALPADWADICERHNLVAGPAQSKFSCPIDDFVPSTTELDVRELLPHDVPAWARIIRNAFGMSQPNLTPMLDGTMKDPQARAFGAFDGDELVAAGAVHVVGDVASINTGGTLPTHRGRGAQSALLTARAAAAAAAGCRLLAVETGTSPADGSHRNVVRSGFTHHYGRTSWTWAE